MLSEGTSDGLLPCFHAFVLIVNIKLAFKGVGVGIAIVCVIFTKSSRKKGQVNTHSDALKEVH